MQTLGSRLAKLEERDQPVRATPVWVSSPQTAEQEREISAARDAGVSVILFSWKPSDQGDAAQ